MKFRNKILVVIILIFIIIMLFFNSSSYAAIMTQDEWNQFREGILGVNGIETLFGAGAVNSTGARAAVTVLRVIQVTMVGLCVITLTIAGIRNFMAANNPGERARDHGDIWHILIISALVMFVLGGGIELLIQALV